MLARASTSGASPEEERLGAMIGGLKQKTEETLSRKLGDLRSEEAAVMSFLQARLKKKVS